MVKVSGALTRPILRSILKKYMNLIQLWSSRYHNLCPHSGWIRCLARHIDILFLVSLSPMFLCFVLSQFIVRTLCFGSALLWWLCFSNVNLQYNICCAIYLLILFWVLPSTMQGSNKKTFVCDFFLLPDTFVCWYHWNGKETYSKLLVEKATCCYLLIHKISYPTKELQQSN